MSKGKKKRRPIPPSEKEATQPDPLEERTNPETPKRSTRLLPRIPKPKTKGGGLIELAIIVALALGLALAIQAWLIKPYQIPSGSMEPTLHIGQRVLVNRFIYDFKDPRVGDIVVFHPPSGADSQVPECGVQPKPGEPCPEPTEGESSQSFIKRVVAGPGDRVRVIHGQAIVNGEANPAANAPAENELVFQGCGKPLPRSRWKEVSSDEGCNFTRSMVVAPGHYFMMGDHRDGSDDSRFWGPVPRSWIVGEAFATYWPPDRIGTF
jgi:signal peptidase I